MTWMSYGPAGTPCSLGQGTWLATEFESWHLGRNEAHWHSGDPPIP